MGALALAPWGRFRPGSPGKASSSPSSAREPRVPSLAPSEVDRGLCAGSNALSGPGSVFDPPNSPRRGGAGVYGRPPLDGGREVGGPKRDGCDAGVARRRRPVPREGAALVCAVDPGTTSG